jgi:hypothetical protein
MKTTRTQNLFTTTLAVALLLLNDTLAGDGTRKVSVRGV